MAEKVAAFHWEQTDTGTGRGRGEDAVPGTEGGLLSVADGCGGISMMIRGKINPMLFYQETMFDAAMDGLISPSDPGYISFRNQFLENFITEKYDLRRDYREENGKPSGYFGSGIVSVLIRKYLTDYFSRHSEEDFFQHIAALSPEARREELDRLGQLISGKLAKDLKKAAGNCCFHQNMGRTAQASLMATTYTGILYREHERYVDVLSFQAGDSLPYAILFRNGRNGDAACLKKLQQAQEGPDGGLTNYLDAGHEGQISCRYVQIPKPCILLCATDGIFDVFLSQAHFERFLCCILYDSFENCEFVPDLVRRQMETFYSGSFSKDDSASLAMAVFGVGGENAEELMRRAVELTQDMDLDNGSLYSWVNTPESLLKLCTNERNQAFMKQREDFWRYSAWLRETAIRQEAEMEGNPGSFQGNLQERARSRFMDRPLRLILECVENHTEDLQPDFAACVQHTREKYQEKIRSLTALSGKKEELLKQYTENAESLIGEEERKYLG